MPDPKRLKVLGNLRGEDGYTPVKGVDYFTEDDKNELVEMVMEALPEAEGADY